MIPSSFAVTFITLPATLTVINNINMSEITTKAKAALNNPEQVIPYLQQQGQTFVHLFKSDQYKKAVYSLLNEAIPISGIIGDSWAYVVKEVNDTKMVLDLRDRGINRDLLLNGIREEDATIEFRNQLERLKSEYETVYAFDIGANIGYYVLLEANILDSGSQIFAFEPHPENVFQLRKSLELNGFDDSVQVEQCAIGAGNATAELAVSSHSNTHKIADIGDSSTTIEVPMKSVDEAVSEIELSASDCLILRIDVEGFEHHVFSGMSEVVSRDMNVFLFAEIHSSVPEESKQEMMTSLSDSGFELVYTNKQSAESLSDLSTPSSFHVMAKKEARSDG